MTLLLAAGCGGADSRKARYVEKGERYFAAGNFDKARVEFRNALQIAPTDANARYQLGRVAEKLNTPRDAVGQYQAAIDADPKHMAARAALARLYLLGGLPDRAMELVEPGLVSEPQHPQLLTVRGAAKSQLGDVPGAFEDGEAALELAPDDEYAIALVASLYRQNARSDRAIEIVRAGTERLPKNVDLRIMLAELELQQDHAPLAAQELAQVIELEPTQMTHRYRLARLYLLQKDVARAEHTLRDAVAAAPTDSEAKLALADLLAAQVSVDKAEAELKGFIAKERDDGALQLALARFYETHNRGAQAEAVYRALIDTDGKQPEALMARNRLAALLLKRREIDPALALVAHVLEASPRDNDALILRGNIALARGDAPAAIADLRSVLRDQPNSTPVMRALARAHVQNNEVPMAEETLRSALQANPGDQQVMLELSQLLIQSGRSQQARGMLEQLVVQAPADVRALETLFRVQASLKDVAAARATAESIQRVRPDLPLGYYLRGVVEEAAQKYDAAVAAYERALEVQPDGAEPLTAVVRVDLARKQPAQALARLDKVIEAQPTNAVARNLKGELLTSRGDTAAAVAVFNDAIAKAPRWWLPYRGLALANMQAKQTDSALAALERGVQQADGYAALGTDLAALYERLGRPNEAIRVYESLVTRDPASVSATNNLAMLLVSYRRDQASLDRAQQLTARLTNIGEPEVVGTRGWVKFKRGELQESLTLLQQAVEQAPESPVMRYHLAMAQLATGDRANARRNLEAAVGAKRNFHGEKEAQAALDEIKRAG